MKINRKIKLANRTFFLFGPRGTGKSTWLKDVLPQATVIDLLKSSNYLSLLKNPSLLRDRVLGLKKGAWIVVDEIQKLPILLDEVHSLLTDFKDQYFFALTGSSARKLKRNQANLLAGRAQTHNMYPITIDEMGNNCNIEKLLQFGTLPEVLTLKDSTDKIEFLESYVQTYLKEEIQQETKIRDLLGFTRFLDVAAIVNCQQLNISSIARDVGLARSTIQGHFSILIDTLLGQLIEPYRPRAKVKEVSSPKFYFFDPGIVTTLKGMLRVPLETSERGYQMETLFLNELLALNSYNRLGGKVYYWRTADGNEVDFIFKLGRKVIGFEIKSTNKWKYEYNYGLKTLLDTNKIDIAFGIYLGDSKLQQQKITILPFWDFPNEFRQLLEGYIGVPPKNQELVNMIDKS